MRNNGWSLKDAAEMRSADRSAIRTSTMENSPGFADGASQAICFVCCVRGNGEIPTAKGHSSPRSPLPSADSPADCRRRCISLLPLRAVYALVQLPSADFEGFVFRIDFLEFAFFVPRSMNHGSGPMSPSCAVRIQKTPCYLCPKRRPCHLTQV